MLTVGSGSLVLRVTLGGTSTGLTVLREKPGASGPDDLGGIGSSGSLPGESVSRSESPNGESGAPGATALGGDTMSSCSVLGMRRAPGGGVGPGGVRRDGQKMVGVPTDRGDDPPSLPEWSDVGEGWREAGD